MDRRERDRYKDVGVLETIAIHLGIWTGPSDVEVPPFPWKRVLIATGVALAATTVLVVALLAEGESTGEREAEADAAERRRIVAQVTAEQRPQRARLVPPLPASADAAERRRHRERLVGALEAAITEDAQARRARGALPADVTHTECGPFVRPRRADPPEPPLSARSGRYECFAVSNDLPATERNESGVAGFPFWARVDFERGRAVWCKVRPRPAEGGVTASIDVPLARECELRRG